MENSYQVWLCLNNLREQFHADCTEKGLWSEPQAREAYFKLEREVELAWANYVANRSDKSVSEALTSMNEVYHSRFD